MTPKSKKSFEKKLGKLRHKIDVSDKVLLKNLSDRFKVVTKIAQLKKKQKVETRQKARFDKILKDRVKRGKKLKMNEKFIVSLMHLIHEESIRFQNALNKKGKK